MDDEALGTVTDCEALGTDYRALGTDYRDGVFATGNWKVLEMGNEKLVTEVVPNTSPHNGMPKPGGRFQNLDEGTRGTSGKLASPLAFAALVVGYRT